MSDLYSSDGRNVGSYDKGSDSAKINGYGNVQVDEDGYVKDSNGGFIGRINDRGEIER